MKKQDRLVRGSTSVILILTLLVAFAGTMSRSAPAQETGRLVVTIVDEAGQARGGACILIVDGVGSEQKACDDDGDGTILVDGLTAGAAKVVALQGAEGCAGSFGGEVEIPAGEEAYLTLSDACEPLPPAKDEKPAEEEKPTEEPKPGLEPNPPVLPTPTAEVKPTEEPKPTATSTPTQTPTVPPPPFPTPTPPPPPTTGEVVITLTSATHGVRSLGACFEVLHRVTGAMLAAGCDGDDGSNDGQVAFGNLTPGPIVVQQVSGDHNDNPAEAIEERVDAGRTTNVDLITLPLADLIVVPVAEDGVTPLYGACFAVYRGIDYSIGRDACAGPDGRAVFPDLPAYYWRLEETIEPTVTLSNGLRQPYTLDGPPFVYHDIGVNKTVIATHHLRLGSLTLETVGADFGQPVYGACAQVDGLAAGPAHLCDSDMDGQIVLSGLAVGDYTFAVTGNAETLNGITYRATEPGAATWSPAARIEFEAMDRTVQIGFVRTASFFVTAIDGATSRPVAGACYTVYAEAANGTRTALDQGCVHPYNTFRMWGEFGLLVPSAGRYVVVQTTAPYGYATPTEQWIDVIATGPHAGTQWVVFYLARN